MAELSPFFEQIAVSKIRAETASRTKRQPPWSVVTRGAPGGAAAERAALSCCSGRFGAGARGYISSVS